MKNYKNCLKNFLEQVESPRQINYLDKNFKILDKKNKENFDYLLTINYLGKRGDFDYKISISEGGIEEVADFYHLKNFEFINPESWVEI